MDENDTRKESATSIASHPLIAFYDALTGVQIECAQLITAIRDQDCEDAEIAAGDAVASYLVAKAALQRLAALPPEPGVDVSVARLDLGGTRRELDALFVRASDRFTARSLRGVLSMLRLSLDIADGQPPPNDLNGAGSR